MGKKVLSTSAPTFVKGGSTGMFGKQSAGPQKAGTTAKNGSGGGKFGKGGSTKMFGQQSASPKASGKVGK